MSTASRKSRRRPRQLELHYRTWGGRRKGAGRKPRRPGTVPHTTRPALASRYPVHVTLSVDPGLPNLRRPPLVFTVERGLRMGKERDGFRLVHYAIQRHHLHLIVEAKDTRALSRGMQGLAIRLACGINRELGRRGRVFVDRYFARILRSPRQVRHTLSYVLLNERRHAAQRKLRYERDWIDPLSSGGFFDGWRGSPVMEAGPDPPVMPPRTWLLRVGWRRHRLIATDEVPG